MLICLVIEAKFLLTKKIYTMSFFIYTHIMYLNISNMFHVFMKFIFRTSYC